MTEKKFMTEPVIKIEKFGVEDIITASEPSKPSGPVMEDNDPEFEF